ncbi:MAG: DUF1059 domain-containing protein [Thermoplasmatales archaeon]|nr:MAG: DUF1059 domain-containing protein [Thermoplasmatales archaeon]
MTLTLDCKDIGTNCPYVAHGETEEELMVDAIEHSKEVLDYTDEQMNTKKSGGKLE